MGKEQEIVKSIERQAAEIRNQALVDYINLMASYRGNLRKTVKILDGIRDYMGGNKTSAGWNAALNRIPDSRLREWLRKADKSTFDRALAHMSCFATSLEKTCALFERALPFVKLVEEIDKTAYEYAQGKDLGTLRAGRQYLRIAYQEMRVAMAAAQLALSFFKDVPFVSDYVNLIFKTFYDAGKAIDIVDKYAERIEKELDELAREWQKSQNKNAKGQLDLWLGPQLMR